MRRYDILPGILLILSIIDFALAAPVSGQEKHQTNVESKDMINVLGKRMDPEEKALQMWEHIFDDDDELLLDSWESYSPGPSLSRPNPGSPRPVEGQAPNPASLNPTSSTAKPGTTLDTIPESPSYSDGWDYEPDWQQHDPLAAYWRPESSTAKPDSTLDTMPESPSDKDKGDYKPNWPDDASAGESSGYESDQESIKAHTWPPNVSPWVDTRSMSSDSDLERDNSVNPEGLASLRPASSIELGQGHVDHDQVLHRRWARGHRQSLRRLHLRRTQGR